MVEIDVVERGPGEQLRLTDVPGGASVCLDALDLEALCALTTSQLQQLRNPEWRMNDEAGVEET